MRFFIVLAICVSLFHLTACSVLNPQLNSRGLRPNILLVVADDLGYSDLGAFGGDIETPALDQFALEGVRLGSAYASPTCSPTRAMLMTGADNHLVGLGAMAEMILPEQRGKPGYEGELNASAVTVATRLRDRGYHTLMAGKWHLGLRPETSPHARGFEHSFALLEGGASHFNSDGLFPFQKQVHYQENGEAVEWPKDKFSSDVYTQKVIDYIEGGRGDDQPFFAYLSLTAPHWPLQAPEDVVNKYRGQFDAGWDELRNHRITKVAELGLSLGVNEVVHPPDYRPWLSLSEEEQREASREMEIYAAMVDGVDRNIARLRNYLEETGLLDNTVVIFMSDNGAEGAELENMPMMKKFLAQNFDNSAANLGRVNSYVMYGPGWAHASSAPNRSFKGHLAEGGIKVPAFIWRKGVDNKGAIASAPVTVKDISRTITDLAAVDVEGDTYQGRPVAPMSGKSLAPLFSDPAASIHDETEVFAGELYGSRSLRKGNWKILWEAPPSGKGRWELFDLETDSTESVDLATDHPGIVESMAQLWVQYAKESGVIVTNKGLNW